MHGVLQHFAMLKEIKEYADIVPAFLSAKRWIALHRYVFYEVRTSPYGIDQYRRR